MKKTIGTWAGYATYKIDDEEIKNKIEALAEKNGVSKTKIIELCVEICLKKEEQFLTYIEETLEELKKEELKQELAKLKERMFEIQSFLTEE